MVIKPGSPTTLTTPAETILKKPTFLPANVGEAALKGGASEASAAARVFSVGRMIPGLGGSLLAFGVGAKIGTEICGVLGIEGCWTFGSDAADPANPTTGHWVWLGAKHQQGWWQVEQTYTFPAFTWAWSYDSNDSLDDFTWTETTKCFVPPSPPGLSEFVTSPVANDSCGAQPSPKTHTSFAVRHAMQNRTFTYTGADDPGVPNSSYTAPGNWSEEMAKALTNPSASGNDPQAAARVGERIAHELAPNEVKNPYATYVEIPDCDGLLWAACEDLLEELGLEPQRSALGWQGAVLTEPATAVIETSPATGVEVPVPSKVTVTTNPDEAAMPLVVPEPEPGETYDDYVARLSPGLDPERVNVGEGFTDPTVGPNAVLRVQPDPGTRLDPNLSHEVDVQTNPPTAPEPGGAPWSPPPVSSIDLGPLAGISIGCNDFPFGIFCWIGEGLAGAGSAGACPTIGVPMGTSIGISDELAFDLCTFEPAMVIVRPVLILLSAFCLAYMFAAAALGFGGGGGNDD